MRKYRVLLKGQNFWIELSGEPRHLGFFTMRFVEASNADEAERQAVRLVRNDPKLAGIVLNERSDPPVICVEEVEEVSSFDKIESSPAGFTFYPEAEKGEA